MNRTRYLLMSVALAATIAAIFAGRGDGRAAARSITERPAGGPGAYALAPGQMAVSVVHARYFPDGKGKLNQNCSVEIRDSAGNQVAGATVTVQMTGDWLATLQALTIDQRPPNGDYYAQFGRIIKGTCGRNGMDAFTCTVTNVTHPSLTYVPEENTMTSDTDADCYR